MCPHSDAITLTYGHPHGHGDGISEAEDVQQGETEALTIRFSGFTGKAGTTPERKAAFDTKYQHINIQNTNINSYFQYEQN